MSGDCFSFPPLSVFSRLAQMLSPLLFSPLLLLLLLSVRHYFQALEKGETTLWDAPNQLNDGGKTVFNIND